MSAPLGPVDQALLDRAEIERGFIANLSASALVNQRASLEALLAAGLASSLDEAYLAGILRELEARRGFVVTASFRGSEPVYVIDRQHGRLLFGRRPVGMTRARAEALAAVAEADPDLSGVVLAAADGDHWSAS